MESKSAGLPGHPTVLTGKRDDITFEMWIEIDGRPLKVYGEAEMEGGGSEAWIASENGKVRFANFSPIATTPRESHRDR